MPKIDLDQMESRLLDERRQAEENIERTEADEDEGRTETAGELSRTPDHQADIGSDTEEAEKDWSNAARASEQLARIDEALRLLREDPEAYLRCERCGREIEAGRLDLVPWTRKCAACARLEDPSDPAD